MLTYSMEQRGSQPLYQFLYEQIKRDILSGSIHPDQRLPSKRSLAEHLKVSVLTVQNAYAQLASEGYIYSLERSGYFAASLLAPAVTQEKAPAVCLQNSVPVFSLDLCENSVPSEHFPFSVWSGLMRRVLSEQEPGLLQKPPNQGALPLRKAIAGYLFRFRGMRVSPEQIVIGAGTEYLYGLLVKLLGRDQVYAVEDPGYHKIADIYQAEGVCWVPVGLDASGMRIPSLVSSGANIVHISPSHHFPTGRVTPIARRQEILRWAAEQEDRYIIEDDYDSEFRFSGRPLPTLASIDVAQSVIYINTFSKTLFPGMRISYIVLPPRLLQAYRQRLGAYSCTVASFEQYTLAKFLEGGHFERHINRMRRVYRLRRDAVINAITAAFGPRAQILEEDAGLHFIMKLSLSMTDKELMDTAARQGIRISCLSQYCHVPHPSQQGMVIINYSGLSPDRVSDAFSQLARVIGPQ